ncbi:DUF4270 domain-containing protein [Psychroserpens jangbogonensis]|uniref:DUF4270 domain-containing protein n=1 Tax=Psychroserpens jangbogonensis TaxID=1484460 RepID=UPI00053F1F81|nr:DUF4270 domain-containing protein [Psychroserpens jangbogonensis]
MKNKKIALRNLMILAITTSFFIACDKDFATIESDIINDDNATNFDTFSREFDVIAFTKALPPVQTSLLPVNMLGVYNDDIYGQTTGNIVTQLRSSLLDPDFGDGVILDSVVISIPYFSRAIEVNSDGETIYELDSVFGSAEMKLSIYESNYFLRDFDPTSSINDSQVYYSDQSTGTSPISDSQLEGTLIHEIPVFIPSAKQIQLKNSDQEITGRSVPALRISFNADDPTDQDEIDYWQEKIIDKEDQPELSNTNNFNDYFRGLYFKSEANVAGTGTMSLLNFANSNANVTLYYTRDNSLSDSDPIQTTFVLSFTGNRANFLSNDHVYPVGDEIQGDELLYLKGGEGSIATIKLFDGENTDDDILFNSFETFKNEFVEIDEDGKFIKSKKLINEAHLIFYVDQSSVNNVIEPERIYLYNMDNNTPLIDYFFDTASTITPVNSRTGHLGRLEREDGEDGNGVRYKIRITEHINNLLIRDSTNVSLGLAVSGNVNVESNSQDYDVLNTDDSIDNVPVSSIVTQRGTVLIGNNTMDPEKKLYLEIFYTEPNN